MRDKHINALPNGQFELADEYVINFEAETHASYKRLSRCQLYFVIFVFINLMLALVSYLFGIFWLVMSTITLCVFEKKERGLKKRNADRLRMFGDSDYALTQALPSLGLKYKEVTKSLLTHPSKEVRKTAKKVLS